MRISDFFVRAVTAARWRSRAAILAGRHLPRQLRAWIGWRLHVSRYQALSEDELKRTRQSDTVFIFGSGASLNGISADEWRAMEAHDTMGFSWFVRQTFVRCDYHMVREVSPTDLDPDSWRRDLITYFDVVKSNPRFASTILLVQKGFKATSGNRAIGLELIPRDRRIFFWRSLPGREAPSPSLTEGLTHNQATLDECVNFAFLMGWTTIVLVGVDLYDRRYFWLGPDERPPHDPEVDQSHRTALNGVVRSLGRWRALFERSGVRLFVYNPRSLLVGTLPLWTGPTP